MAMQGGLAPRPRALALPSPLRLSIVKELGYMSESLSTVAHGDGRGAEAPSQAGLALAPVACLGEGTPPYSSDLIELLR